MKILEFTQRFLAVGIAIIPLFHRSKTPMLASWREFQSRLPTHTEYLDWFRNDWCNYAVICGWNNLVVIDFDNIEFYNIWRLWLSGTQYAVNGLQVRTRQGMHVYVRTEAPAHNDKRISIKGGTDVQAQGKYVVGPGCVHPSGSIYQPQGEMIFPMVESIDAILPLHLFPRVAPDRVQFNGAPVHIDSHTEYQDLFTFASMDLISKVKASVRIESFYAGVEKSSVGNHWLKALCPFHQDKHQSAWIDTQRQLAGCQVCGMKPMDVINVYARMHNISDRAAVTAMAAEVGVWR
jgi:hypothetical protein